MKSSLDKMPNTSTFTNFKKKNATVRLAMKVVKGVAGVKVLIIAKNFQKSTAVHSAIREDVLDLNPGNVVICFVLEVALDLNNLIVW